MHQLDRIENMLQSLVGSAPDSHVMNKQEVKRLVESLFSSMNGGSKIDAIRYYRTLTDMGLKDSKDAVEVFFKSKT